MEPFTVRAWRPLPAWPWRPASMQVGDMGSGGRGAWPWCDGVLAAGLGSSLAMEPFEAPKTPENPLWEGWGGVGKSFCHSWHTDMRPPKSSQGWAASCSKHCRSLNKHRSTYVLVPTMPIVVPHKPQEGSAPCRTGDTEGPGMASQPHLSSASLFTSLCLRFHICEMGLTTQPPTGELRERHEPAVQ